MMTQLHLDVGVRGKFQQATISYKLFLHSTPLGPMIKEIKGLFNKMTPIWPQRYDMEAILKANLIKPAAIFKF